MRYYPVYLNLVGRRVLIVGAGQVAWQKLEALLESEAQICVVAPDGLFEIEELARAGKIERVRRPYQSSDLDEAHLVIAATDDPELQKQVAAEARARRQWVNVVDVTPLCDFIAPAIVARGNLQIAISTGGTSPALAKFIRQKLEGVFGPEYADLTRLLEGYRPEILKLPKERRQKLWEAIITQEFIDRVRSDGMSSAETHLKRLLHDQPLI